MDWITLTHREIESDALPDVCVHCGAEAAGRHNKTFEWHPDWAGWLLLAGWLPGALAIALTQKKRRVSLPVCPSHHPDATDATLWSATRTGMLLLAGLAFIPIGMAVTLILWQMGGGQAEVTQVILVGGLGGALGGLIVVVGIAMFQKAGPEGPVAKSARPLVVQEITADGISLEGVDDAFVRAMREKRQGGGDATLPAQGPPPM